MSIYEPLRTRLEASPQAAVTLSFDEIERLLGRRLPPSAYDEKIKRQWWANTDTHSQARAWLKAGRKARLDRQRDAVTFTKAAPENEQGLVVDRLKLTGAACQLLEKRAAMKGLTQAAAAAEILNEAARADRLALIQSFAGKSRYSSVSSADMIREDRDAR